MAARYHSGDVRSFDRRAIRHGRDGITPATSTLSIDEESARFYGVDSQRGRLEVSRRRLALTAVITRSSSPAIRGPSIRNRFESYTYGIRINSRTTLRDARRTSRRECHSGQGTRLGGGGLQCTFGGHDGIGTSSRQVSPNDTIVIEFVSVTPSGHGSYLCAGGGLHVGTALPASGFGHSTCTTAWQPSFVLNTRHGPRCTGCGAGGFIGGIPPVVGGVCGSVGGVCGSVGGVVGGFGSVGAGGFMVCGGGELDEHAAASVTTNGVANDRRGLRAGIAATLAQKMWLKLM
jgi:hypothetical protein